MTCGQSSPFKIIKLGFEVLYNRKTAENTDTIQMKSIMIL